MNHYLENDTTICAISTPYGKGGIAVVRISGRKAISIVSTLFTGKQPLHECKSHTLSYGKFSNLDDVVVSIFRAPHSFTGEDVVEISCHGSLYIQQQIINTLIESGCELARAGEFTQRAFLNGKMDLTMAESVADLIAAESQAAHQLALSHLRGGISNDIKQLRAELLNFTSLIELELDFADHEELEFANRTALHSLCQQIENHIYNLLLSFKQGNAIKNGVPVAIIGNTNVGKSTLLNALVGEQRAIVSDIEGTTRDTIEDTVSINGVLYRFIDTAGIRETENEVERIGIERSRQAAKRAEIILYLKDNNDYLTDSASSASHLPLPLLQNSDIDLANKTIIVIYNKIDLLEPNVIPAHNDALPQAQNHIAPSENTIHTVAISAKNNHIDSLKQILHTIYSNNFNTPTATISNLRHYDALRRAYQAIRAVANGLQNDLSGEILALDLHDCLNALGEITGEITSDEILGNIFSHFCIGK